MSYKVKFYSALPTCVNKGKRVHTYSLNRLFIIIYYSRHKPFLLEATS